MYTFFFEPGDGCSYRVIFGRIDAVAPRALVPGYTVFGIAEGYAEPGAWYAFDANPRHISDETFHRHIYNGTIIAQTYWTAWRLWLALTGQGDDAMAARELPEWRADWREQLPLVEL